MKPAKVEITIARAPEDIHTELEDIGAHRRFHDRSLTDWKIISRSRRGVGAGARAVGRGRHPKVVIRVIKSSDRRVVVESRAGKGYRRKIRWTYKLKRASGGHTRVSVKLEYLDGGLVDRARWPFTRARTRRAAGRGLRSLRESMEGAVNAEAQEDAVSSR